MAQQGWQTVLSRGGTFVLDGGTGSELRRRGMALDPLVWSALAPLTHYELLRAIHSDYIAAGADVVTTSTFATTRFVLEAAGRGDDFAAVNARAVGAAREARDASGRDVAIAGSISCLPPGFDVQAYPDENEESAAYLECAEASTIGLPVWLGVSCRVGAGGALVGFDFPLVPLATTLDALLPYGPDAIAVMHSPVAAVAPALREIGARWRGPLGAYPEIGDGTAATEGIAPEELAAQARDWVAGGARIIGGCCGTQPKHIRALAALRAAT